ncbi:methyltransferase-like protein 22 [Paramormyrops kingsleyae]|uniref:methyltransferase-like protein 22 n=1 Tax=Paramormyrops kingsleyae TaxID=1676925 RepID=UPI003B96E5DE
MDQVTFRSDTVLSDVHLLIPNARHLMVRLNAAGQPVFVSRFKILQCSEGVCSLDGGQEGAGEQNETQTPPQSLVDEDGDLDVVRRPRESRTSEPDLRIRDRVNPTILSRGEATELQWVDEEEYSKDVIKIEHTMATPLEDVGKQVWRGAFLMADFILSQPELFKGSTALELGAGMGFTSLAMATVAKRVYCTDVGRDLLGMCQRNVALNRHLLESAGGEVKVRELDWMGDDFPSDAASEFGWSEEEIADLHDGTTVLIAADLCYDEDLTDSLFRTLYRMTSNLHQPSAIYLSIEKRLNFTIQHLDISCEAYDHFRRCLRDLGGLTDGKMRFSVESVETRFPQFFEYERVEQLELWKVTASFVSLKKREKPVIPVPLEGAPSPSTQ